MESWVGTADQDRHLHSGEEDWKVLRPAANRQVRRGRIVSR